MENDILSMDIKLGDTFRCIKQVTLKHRYSNNPNSKEQVVSYNYGDTVEIEALIGYGTYFNISKSGYKVSRCILAEHFVFTGRREDYMQLQTPDYYNNTNCSLYKVATQRGWGPYLFDLVKRLERGGKKDPLRQEIEKSIVVLQLWLSELEDGQP
jgi:hypothetical protein